MQKEIHGQTQGTTYSIIIVDDEVHVSKKQFDSIFEQFDNILSTYIDNSAISFINESKESVTVRDNSKLFQYCYELSQSIYSKTNGAFDPSVFPLVKGWGFMNDMDSPLSSNQVDSILNFVSFENKKYHSVSFKNDLITFSKSAPNFKIDFNAIAQGQSVDVVCDFLRKNGHENFFVEIGGELRVSGLNQEGDKWRIGIDTPKEDLEYRKLENVIHVSDLAVATSGNYRKFYVKNGVKYSHTLNPKTGYPVKHSLLSVTVVTDNCAKADGYATAFMVMGKEKTLEFVSENPSENLAVYLLSSDENDSIVRDMSSNFDTYLPE